MTPRQARAARAFLGLDMKTVCKLANVGKRTLTEFESGSRSIAATTEAKIKAFYIANGVSFTEPSDGEGIQVGATIEDQYNANDVPREKFEFVDLFSVEEISSKIKIMIEIADKLQKRPTISQIIVKKMAAQSALNQKELAGIIGLSPSFMNAVFVGKKSFPSAYCNKIKAIIPEHSLAIERALHADKKIQKIQAQIKEMQQNYLAAWTSIYWAE